MKYPTLNKKQLTKEQKSVFNTVKKTIKQSVSFDNQENELGLNKSSIELLAWNAATQVIASYSLRKDVLLVK